jgi:hypothetical protein
MYVDGSKIKSLISVYGNSKDYPEKSHTALFCKDFELSYNQWNAYTRGAQLIGTKVTQKLIEIFPDLNLNWFFKDMGEMFISEHDYPTNSRVPNVQYSTKTDIDNLNNKLEEMLSEIKKMNSKSE